MDEEKGASRTARKRLEALQTTDDFDAFCLDNFPEAYRQFSSGMTRRQKENVLLERFDSSAILRALELHAHESQDPEKNRPLAPAFAWSPLLLRGMPWRAAESIQRFLLSYLGTERQPAAFGGRTKQIERLKAWADSPQTPYLILQAPTGRGKSALLCRLIQALAQGAERELVFLPVSLRFGLSLAGDVLPALLGRLAVLHSEPPPRNPDKNEAKALLSRLLRQPLRDGRRLLVVLDGLDEASGWEFGEEAFPQLPPGTKVLLSMRQTHAGNDGELRQRFGLKPSTVLFETLPALDLLEVSQAVRALQIPDLAPADEARIAERLHALSEGDPLVLSLLLDECQLPDVLEQLRATAGIDLIPGLSGLWARMLKPSEQAALSPSSPTWKVFALLSCARAPLDRDDLIALAGLETGEALAQALQPIRRWILRSGDGYVFSHPRLREFFYEEKLGAAEQQKWERRFIDWAQRTVHALQNGDSFAPQIPPYLMQCLTIHLQEHASSAADWTCILSDAWKQAWEKLPLGRAGLLRDLERAQRAFGHYNQDAQSAGKPAPHLIEYLRCTLWTASLRSYENTLPLALLPELMAHALLTPAQALEHVRSHLSLHDADSAGWGPSQLENVLLLLAETFPSEVVELAFELADREKGGEREPLLALLKHFARADLEIALLSARRLHSSFERASALLVIAENLPEADAGRRAALQKEALEQAWKLLEPYEFLNLVPSLSQRFEPADRDELLVRAMQLALALPQEGSATHYLTSLFKTELPPEQRDRVFLAALDSACQIERPFEIQCVLDRSARISQAALSEGLERLIRRNRSDGIVAWLFHAETAERWSALQTLLSPSFCDQIAQTACDIAEKEWLRSWEVEKIRALDIIGRRKSALAAVRATPTLRQQQIGLLRLADWIPQEETQKLISASLPRARGSEAQRLAGLALSFLSADTFDATAEILLKVIEPAVRVSGLLKLRACAPERMTAALSTAIETALAEVTDAEDQIDLLYQVFEQNPTLESLDCILTEAAELGSDSPSLSNRADRLSRLAPALNEPHRARAWACVFELLNKLPAHVRRYRIEWLLKEKELPEPLRQKALVMLRQEMKDRHVGNVLPHVPGPQEQKELLLKTMSATRTIEDEGLRIETAAMLRPSESLCAELIRRADALDAPEGRFRTLISLSDSLPFLHDRASDAACRVGLSLLFSPNLLARSFLLYRGSPAIIGTVVQESFARACKSFAELAPVLSWWRVLPADDCNHAYHDLKLNQQNQINELRSILRDIGSHLSASQAERVLAEAPWFWFDVRAKAAARLPGESRAAIVQEEWARSRSLPDVEKAGALSYLAPALADAERRALVTESLAAAGFFTIQGSGADNRPGVLFHVAPYLEDCHLTRAAALAVQAWPSALGSLPAFLARVPAALRDRLGKLIYAHAQTLAPSQAATVMAQTAPHLGKAELTETIRRVSSVDNLQSAAGLAGAAPQMDALLLTDAFRQLRALTERSRTSSRDMLLQACATLAAALVQKQPKHRSEVLAFLVHVLKERGTKRPELLHTLGDLAPLMSVLGDPGTPDAAALEVLDVASRWP